LCWPLNFAFGFFSGCSVVNSRPAALLSSLPSSNAKDAIERAHNLRFLGGREKAVQEAIFLAGIQGPVEGAAPTCADFGAADVGRDNFQDRAILDEAEPMQLYSGQSATGL
jgi:hypothetical protein